MNNPTLIIGSAASHQPLARTTPHPIGPYSVELKHAANPDIGGGYWQDTPPKGKKVVWVESLAAASQACQQFISEWGLGGGNWTGGLVRKNGQPFARISYNGRAWEAHRDFPDALEIDLKTEQVIPKSAKL